MSPGLFRYVLALTVFIHHLTRLSIGNMAVYVFFVLSGYWIARMWMGRYSKSERPFSTFYLSRSLRLIPTFVMVNFFTVLVWLFVLKQDIVEASQDNLLHAVISNTLIVGYASLETQFLVPAWSLDIEIQFYILAPILAYLVFFAVGMATALMKWRVPAWLSRISLGGGFAIILLIIAIAPLRDLLIGGVGPHGALFAYNLDLNAALALVFAPFALSTTQNRSGPIDSMFGDMSFVIYLVHWSAVLIVSDRYGSLPAVERLPYVVAAIFLSMLVAYVMWQFFDRPINRWRASFIDRRLHPRP